MLKSGCALREANSSNIKNNYSTIRKKFTLRKNNNLFTNIFNEMVNSYKKKLQKKFIKQSNKSSLLELFIDSTNIRNKNGKELIGNNYQDKFKNDNKVTIVCGSNKFAFIAEINRANIHDAKILVDSKSINESFNDFIQDIYFK